MKPNDLKAYKPNEELNEQEMTDVTGGFIEPAPSTEEVFKDLFGEGAKVELEQPAGPNNGIL